MLGDKFPFESGALGFVVLHFLVPEIVEVAHLLLVGFVDFVDLVLVTHLHFIHASQVQLLSHLL